MEWQPIETAPKDGTSVFLWLPFIDGVQHERRIESSWGCYWRNENKNGPAYNVRYVRGKSGMKEPVSEFIRPSHWMPTPGKPATTNRE